MNSFQKTVLLLIFCGLLIIGYYYLITLPQHNKVIIELNKKEVLLKEREQDQILQDKEFEKQQKIEQAEQNRLNDLKRDCELKGKEIKREYNNIFSVNFNEYLEECYVKYYDDDNVIQDSPVDEFGAKKREIPIIPLYGIQTILKGVNFRTLPTTDANVIQEIDPTNIVTILGHREIDGDLRYNIDFYGKEGWISSIGFGQ